MFYIYRKGFVAGAVRLGALFWCFTGFCVNAVLHRDMDWLMGTLRGMCTVLGKLEMRDFSVRF